jgi:cytochrome P450
MVRQTTRPETFRKRAVPEGALLFLCPWHLGRHERLWDRPHAFDPDRWAQPETRETARRAYLPFSSGPRVCTGAGFAMVEGVLLLAQLLRAFRFETVAERTPVPVHHLTVRAKEGIWLRVTPRQRAASR